MTFSDSPFHAHDFMILIHFKPVMIKMELLCYTFILFSDLQFNMGVYS